MHIIVPILLLICVIGMVKALMQLDWEMRIFIVLANLALVAAVLIGRG